MTIPLNETAPALPSDAGGTNQTPESIALLVNAKAAAAMLDLGARTLWSLTKCEAIPALWIGRSIRYSPDELRGWIAAGCPTEPGSADRVRAAMREGVSR